jgi:hypothetical protein
MPSPVAGAVPVVIENPPDQASNSINTAQRRPLSNQNQQRNPSLSRRALRVVNFVLG